MEFSTDFPRLQATLDPVPRFSVVHPFLQPTGVIPEPILLVASVRDDLTSALVGDNEGKDGEGEENNDEQEHHEQVEPEEPCHATARADEAGE